MTTRALHPPSPRRDGHLWMTALVLSLLINTETVAGIGTWIIQADWNAKKSPVPKAATESEITIFLKPVEPAIQKGIKPLSP